MIPRLLLTLLVLTPTVSCGGDALSPEDVDLRIELTVVAVRGSGDETDEIPAPQTVRPGDRIRYDWSVTNAGSKPIPIESFFRESMVPSRPAIRTRTDSPSIELDPGDKLEFSPGGEFAVPVGTPPGQVTLRVGVVVPTGEVAELYEATVEGTP